MTQFGTMKLSYFHVAGDVPLDLEPDAAVVIDVLRATTTIACALSNGAEAILTFDDIQDLKNQSLNWPAESRLLLGERGGKRIQGFDLGNSPVDVVSDVVNNKRIFMSTTNGTRSFQRVKNVKTLYGMALINRKAVADKLLNSMPENLWILGSGWEGAYSMEDSLAAGALASYLLKASSNKILLSNDEMNAAIALWEYWSHDLVGCLRSTTHGQRLEKLGNHDDDFECCADLDKVNVVPAQIEPGILRSL